MTSRETLFASLRGGEPERIPIIGHVDSYNRPDLYGLPAEIAEAARKYGWWSGDAAIVYARLLNIDIAAWTKAPLVIKQKNCVSEEVVDGQDTINIIHTPAGDIREIIRQSEEMSFRVEHFLKSPEDFAPMAEFFEDQTIELDTEGVKMVEERAEDINDDGILISPLPGTPLGMLIRVYAGPQNTAYLHADAPEELAGLLKVMGKNHGRQFMLAAGSQIDAFLGMDDTSTSTQSPAMFERYCMDYTNMVADILHAKNKMYWHHSCGLIKDLLPLYRQTRMNAVHALNEPPTGNVWINEARKVLGGGIGIISGPQVMKQPFTDRQKTAVETEKYFRRLDKHCCICLSGFRHLKFDDIKWLREKLKKMGNETALNLQGDYRVQ
ncbi:MAG: hypothetical protein JW957_08860 [Candidatus Omnitrophica bacterium]|nr:hypothetical protein [Candidatus Omnitrophota bacterium]